MPAGGTVGGRAPPIAALARAGCRQRDRRRRRG